MGKLLRNTTLRSVGRAIVSLLLFFCFSQGVWATAYTIYFLRPSGEGRWGNTPRVHIYYNDAQGDHVIVDGGTSDGDMTNVAAELYSKTFETDKSSISLIFNNGGWGSNSDTKSNSYGPWTPESGIYFTTSNNYQQAVTTYNVRQFSSGEFIYLKNYSPSCISENWICSSAQYAYLYMWGGTAGVHTYRFELVSGYGEEYATDAKYGAEIETAGTYAYLIITRGNVSCTDGSFPEKYNQTGNIAIDPTKNYISSYECSSSSVTWEVFDPCTAPTPSTGSASNITSVSATLNANITLGTCTPTFIGVSVYSDAACATEPIKNVETEYVANQTAYYLNVSGLSPLTTYYYKAYVKTSFVTLYASSSESFDTECLIITVLGPGSGDMKLCKNSGTMLAVSASGASDYTYQWYYNSTKSTTGATEILGATNDKYSPNILGTEYYYCVVQAPYSCTTTSDYSGAITYDSSKESPIITASATSVTNYAPVTLTVTGADVDTWNVSGGVVNSWYLYKESGTGAMFKGNVGSGSAVVYTVTGTTDDDCSSAVNITVRSNTPNCK